jgi:mono/diheme cytochrome c family protein
MSSFHEDQLKNEKKDPVESSSAKFVNVPLTLLAMFLGFGVTYLALRTDRVTMQEGDSRTHAPSAPNAGSQDQGSASDATALLEHGKQVFTTTCQACHQANGAGIPGTFPPLEDSEWVAGSPKRIAAIVLHGINGEIVVKGQKFQNVMPTFKDQLSTEDIAAVVTYVRQTFGKKTDVVTPALVEEVKKSTQSRSGPWAGGAELEAQKWE